MTVDSRVITQDVGGVLVRHTRSHLAGDASLLGPGQQVQIRYPHGDVGLVLSSKLFNQQGLAMICPISQGAAEAARNYGTVVTLVGSGTETQGAVHCHQLKALDWRVRKAKFKEEVPVLIIDEVWARVEAILSGD